MDGKLPFRSVVGSLLYVATGTRPEIAFAVSIELKSGETKQKHWNVAICLFQYLKLTLISGICYQGKRGVLKMSAYSDADWGSNKDNISSTSGVIVIIYNSPVILSRNYNAVYLQVLRNPNMWHFCCAFKKCCGRKVYCWE